MMTKKRNKNNTFAELKQIIESYDDLLIISHVQPDGDNIGSVIALMRSLELAGKNVRAVCNGSLPERYAFLRGAERLCAPAGVTVGENTLVLALDCSDRGRFGTELAEKIAGRTLVNIDHHISNDYFGDYNYVDATAAATGEILTRLLQAAHWPLDGDIAAALYVAILTDCGNFTFSNTTARTLRAAALLLTYPVELESVRENVWGNLPLARKKLLSLVLANAVQDADERLVYSSVSQDEYRALAINGADFENIIDHLVEVRGCKLAILLREPEEGVSKLSFRAQQGYDAVAVASAFGGGGHRSAAGATVQAPAAEALAQVLAVARTYLKEQH